ncbi:MAG TPA: hypothetical protein VHZ25_07655 [Acidobacteriaceae bacterium]|jgi:hypothetical protein|nr:hypothetical protein [Acidobacteriaceae bacterium]
MRFTSLKNLSFGLALASLVSVGVASAQSLVGVNAKLDRTLDSKSAAVGQTVTAKLDGAVTLSGTKLARGTELMGKVAEVKSGNPVSVTLLFTSAKLKDGKEIPVKATLIAASSESDPVGVSLGDVAAGGAPTQIEADRAFNQQPGALEHVGLTSAVKDHDSGTFTSTSGNFKLVAGTNLQVGIAAASSASGTSAAE